MQNPCTFKYLVDYKIFFTLKSYHNNFSYDIYCMSYYHKGSLQKYSIPTKPRFRSVPDVTDTKFAAPYRTAH